MTWFGWLARLFVPQPVTGLDDDDLIVIDVDDSDLPPPDEEPDDSITILP